MSSDSGAVPPRAPGGRRSPPESPEEGFGSGDYIAFDFDDAGEAPESQSSTPDTMGAAAGGGGKRKRGSAVDDSIQEHAAARSTPWAADVPWHRCRNVAEMWVLHC